ncbi:MAG: FadR/GntR family transcriptional regulator [Polyangiaceae bacterium]|jgi:GntR family transcriptional regulator, transcriptional repressor for pyruvate dehydrogenase complex
MTPDDIPLRPSASAETLAVLGPVARSSVVDAVADRLRGEILAGRLPAGSRLPSERELSLALGVNRLTLRAALARLEALGLVATRHGASTLVTSWRERAGLDSLAALIGSLQPSDPAWFDMAVSLLELRRILATEAVALAAARHTPEQLEAIEKFAEEQKTRVHDPIAYARGEFALERLIIRATGNIALELVLNMFARFPDEHPDVVAALYDQRENAAFFYDLILGLIRGGDPVRARDHMRRAFEIIDADWMQRHRPPGSTLPVAVPASAPDVGAHLAPTSTPREEKKAPRTKKRNASSAGRPRKRSTKR